MGQNVVLIDCENVQPQKLDGLAHENLRVLVFVGANQAKLSFDTAASLQPLGDRAKYVRIAGSGRNALDFHIAYYVGRLAAEDPSARFHIVSGDSGFDPLIAHLVSQGIAAARAKSVSDIDVGARSNGRTPTELSALVIRKLQQPKATKPRTIKTLSSHIPFLLNEQLSGEEIRAVIDALVGARFISIDGAKVTYATK
jgi:hypothetical protein